MEGMGVVSWQDDAASAAVVTRCLPRWLEPLASHLGFAAVLSRALGGVCTAWWLLGTLGRLSVGVVGTRGVLDFINRLSEPPIFQSFLCLLNRLMGVGGLASSFFEFLMSESI